jgi:flagellar biosynthesis/type III secretory pathway protein FliH
MATVIKANGPIRAADGMSFNFDDMSDKAHSYLDDMQKQAAQIIATAHKEAEKIRQRATEEGRQAAIAAVEQVMDEKVGKQLQTLLPALRQAAHEVAEAKQAWLSHWETAAVQLAGKIAERVVRQRLRQEPAFTVGLVREALELAAGSSELVLRMHPDDLQALRNQVETLIRELSAVGTVSIRPDESISRGGCRVDTKFGVVDQQIEAQLARIQEELS